MTSQTQEARRGRSKKTTSRPLMAGGAAMTLLLAGCAGDFYGGDPYGGPIMVGTIFTAKVLAFTTLTMTIIQVGITGAIIIRAIMAEAIMAAGVTVEEAMAAAGAMGAVVVMAAARIHSEFIRRIRPKGHKDFGFYEVTALPGKHLIRSA